VESIRFDPRLLLESDLPTPDEIGSLFAHSRTDMGDIIGVYYAMGCRTHGLIEARCSDFQPNARTLVLGRHKRRRTLREPIPRTITLNDNACAVLARRCKGRPADAYIFPNRKGKPYTSALFDDRFATVRKRAGVRPTITIYSFRHLWISEVLMAGVNVLLVARMAGTSVAMIERVYGHFRNQSYQDAQARLDRERATRGL
jgi:integrase